MYLLVKQIQLLQEVSFSVKRINMKKRTNICQ